MLIFLSNNVVKVHDMEKMTRCLFFIFLLVNATIAQEGDHTKAGPEPGDARPGNEKPDDAKGGDGKGGDDKPDDGKGGNTVYLDSKKWLTLKGAPPAVIARGGFTGLFPESSGYANDMAISTSLPGVIVSCNLQFSKDGVGICQPEVRLDNSTNMKTFYTEADQKTYKVNGQDLKGWFALDYPSNFLFNNLSLSQHVLSRPAVFDGQQPVSRVEDVAGSKPPQFWLNVQYDAFYKEHNLSVEDYIQKTEEFVGINYLSSPEINFLKNIGQKVNKTKTKLVFVFRDRNAVEPTTNQTYGEILKNLTAVKSFASGIVVPKTFIWPVNNRTGYLDPPTTLVPDAHNQGLEVYASGFANDYPLSYNYSFDPTSEYMKYIDNSQFAVDGFVTDSPPTASGAIACFAQNNNTKPVNGKSLIITRNGASGVYPGCSDLAYQQAVDDGADIIDCTVQMTKDGVAFCLDSPDLIGKTTAMPSFMTRLASIPEIQSNNGIFSFDLTWSEIQTLKPQIVSPFQNFQRNPAAKNRGKFVSLDAFLEFAKAKAVTGILINIENAAYLASKKGIGIVDAVSKALKNATFDKQSTQQVLILSDDSSVLSKFTDVPSYKRVLHIKQEISDAKKEAVDETKKYANAVMVSRPSLIAVKNGYTAGFTNVFKEMRSANISVYVSQFRNEYVAIPYDFVSDPIWELACYIGGMEVDGIQTEFPATATRYIRSPCADLSANLPYKILPVSAGDLLNLIPEPALAQAPAVAPAPPLDVADIIDPPLPPVAPVDGSSPPAGSNAKPPSASSNGIKNVANLGLSLLVVMIFCLLSVVY